MNPKNLVTAIAKLATKQAEQGLDEGEQTQLDQCLSLLFKQSREGEDAIVSEVLQVLSETPEAGDCFLCELEIHSELVLLGARKDQAALLFCLPVTFIAGDQLRRIARSTDDMEELTHVLTETEIIGSQTRLGLLPRLFTPQEMVAQSYKALRKLTTEMGEQVLAGEPVRLHAGVLAEGLVANPDYAWGDNAFIDLRYLIGVVVTHVSTLNEVFPAIGAETTEAEMCRLRADVAADEQEARLDVEDLTTGVDAGDRTRDLEEAPRARAPFDDFQSELPEPVADAGIPGHAANGEYWEDVFLQVTDEVFMPMFGAQGTLPPDDFHENFRRGLELWRRSGLQYQVRAHFGEREPVIIVAKQFFEPGNGRSGWDLSLTDHNGTQRDRAPWEILLHEHPEEAESSLRSICELCNWSLSGLESLSLHH